MITTYEYPNSFADVSTADLERLAKLEHHFVAHGFAFESNTERLARRAFLSAVLFGGLLDPDRWQMAWEGITGYRYLRSHEPIYFFRSQKAPFNWYPDPITGCILAMLRKRLWHNPVRVTANTSATAMLKVAMDELAGKVSHEPDLRAAAMSGPEWLRRVSTARLHMRVPALLVQYAAGRVQTFWSNTKPSKTNNKVERLAKFIASGTPKTAWQPKRGDEALAKLWTVFFPKDPAKAAHSRALGSEMRKALDQQIALSAKWLQRDNVHRHLLIWLRSRLDPTAPESGPQSRIRPSTARSYLACLAAMNWEAVRRTSIMSNLASDRLENFFALLLDFGESLPPNLVNVLPVAVASFSDYLHSKNPAIAIHPAAVREVKRTTPRTIVLDSRSFPELLNMLLEWGDTKAEKGEPDRYNRAQKCRLASVLMFRAGLRGAEVLNLALNDITFEGEIAELVVRRSAERANKTRFSRRTLPLHHLLQPKELDDLRQWHAWRCDHEFHCAPRAKLFPAEWIEGLSPEQYLLEPIEAAIRLFVGQSLSNLHTRREKNYWYALASPLRHSFATHLITCLLLPDQEVALPMPQGWTPDLVSAQRKAMLRDAFLPPGHAGLSLMQTVRHLMGHASHTQSLSTYIHRMDWLLAAHLWRDVSQPPTSATERASYLAHLPMASRAARVSVTSRTLSRRSSANSRRRGRPSQAQPDSPRQLSATYDDFIGRYVTLNAFARAAGPGSAESLPTVHRSELPPRGWLAIHNMLLLLRKGYGVETVARHLALPLEVCSRWRDRASDLEQIQMRAKVARTLSTSAGAQTSGAPSPSLSGRPRFPQLSAGYAQLRGRKARTIDQIWEARAGLKRSLHRRKVIRKLSRWQSEPARLTTKKAILKHAEFLTDIGVDDTFLAIRAERGQWQPYTPVALAELPKTRYQLTAASIPPSPSRPVIYHDAVTYGLLLSLIDADIALK